MFSTVEDVQYSEIPPVLLEDVISALEGVEYYGGTFSTVEGIEYCGGIPSGKVRSISQYTGKTMTSVVVDPTQVILINTNY